MMPRIARLIVPDFPHHVIQRGNRNQRVFFSDEDKQVYLRILGYYCQKERVGIWCYCLMDNHVHLIAVPTNENGLARAIGETHKKYTWMVNARNNWKGFLWQGRFLSYPMDEKYLYACVRYIERNPVRAGLVATAEDYPWSSAKAHVYGYEDKLLSSFFLTQEIKDWRAYLAAPDSESELAILRENEKAGRPLGDDIFIMKLERITGKILRRNSRGRPRKSRPTLFGSPELLKQANGSEKDKIGPL